MTIKHSSQPFAFHHEQLLQQVFGYQKYREGQKEIIEAAIEGRDALVIMPTGGGKSLCYQIPSLVRGGLTLVISPLISLMKDQVDQLLSNGIYAACINSSIPYEQQQSIWQAIYNGELNLLYVSPERVLMQDFIERLQAINLSLIAIDEAHCISQWGHDFRPEYAQLGNLKQYFPNIPRIALTATADGATRQDILNRLALHSPYIYLGSFDRPNIRYNLLEKHNAFKQLSHFLTSQKGQSGIIYCNSRKRVEEIAEKLNAIKISSAAYHAGLSNDIRAQVQDDFQRDNVQVVVATVAFGMGINKSNVRFVVHYDVPRNIESYYQETGRAGRDGLPAQALLLFDPSDMAWLHKCLHEKPEGEQKRIESYKLNAMGAFADALTCRRLVLLNYFGEHREQNCGNCDICLNPPSLFNATELAQKALSNVYRVKQSFGINHTVDVLRGMQNQRIKDFGHDKLSTYGIGKEFSKEYWVSIFRQLIHRGFLLQNITQNSVLQLTENARPLLRGEINLQLAIPRIKLVKENKSRKQSLNEKNYDKNLFARLKRLRKSIADEEDKPPFVIFSDKTLAEMAQILPTSQAELLAVNGVGQQKLVKYGDLFLHAIEEYLSSF